MSTEVSHAGAAGAKGNPLADVHAAARRSGVVLRGRWMPARELDAELDKLATQRATPSPEH